MKYIAIKNWETYQHYKDRNPPWIKLHQDLMTSNTWVMSGEHEKALMIGLMLLAAKSDNNIPCDTSYIKRVLHLDKEPNIQFLIDTGFVEESPEQVLRESPWPSRYIPPLVREQVLARDRHICVACSSRENLEIDHIVPISKGGESKIDNLQVLCRSCNRRKRTRVASATKSGASATQDAIKKPSCVDIETERETEGEKRREEYVPKLYSDDFESIWKIYPRRDGSKSDTAKAYNKALKAGATYEIILAGVTSLCTHHREKNTELRFIPHAATWMNGNRWEAEFEEKPKKQKYDTWAN